MPKKIGFLYEKAVTFENCLGAVFEGTDNLKKTKKIKYIRAHAEEYAAKIQAVLSAGWEPKDVNIKVINEGTNRKRRELKIPTTFDHLVHVAIMRPIEQMLLNRFDFFCCGSVPGKGSGMVRKVIDGWLKRKPPKYAAECDVYHFYQTCNKSVVMAQLSRFIKDKRYLALHEKILDQMGGTLAIGFQPSHWYANLVLTVCDRAVRALRGVKFVRFMDNYILVSGRKRTLHNAILTIQDNLSKMGMKLKSDWQVYQTKKRAIKALCYRHFRGYTILTKKLMYRISKQVKLTRQKLNAHNARSLMSLIGFTRHINSYNFRKSRVYNLVSLNECRRLISFDDRKRNLSRQTA